MTSNSNGFDVRHIYFGTDPLWQSYRKVFCQTLKQSITRVQTGNVIAFYLCNRPVSKVEIMGIVLGVEIKDSKVTMFVDDGTAVVRCIKYTYSNQIAKRKSQVHTFQGLRDQGYKILVVPENGDLVLVCGILAIQETNQPIKKNLNCRLLEVWSCHYHHHHHHHHHPLVLNSIHMHHPTILMKTAWIS